MQNKCISKPHNSGVRKNFPRGGPKFRHNRVTSQISFMGSAKGKIVCLEAYVDQLVKRPVSR